MSEKLKDIIEEMRRGMIPKHRHDRELLLNFADRIEAAVKREREATCKDSLQVGNAAKMREALQSVLGIVNVYNYKFIKKNVPRICDAALSAPPRNCDVGTAEEQSKRFKKYCALNKDFEWGCEKCPIFPYKIIKCEFIWSQLPYESEVK